jgi:hypothetical protein
MNPKREGALLIKLVSFLLYELAFPQLKRVAGKSYSYFPHSETDATKFQRSKNWPFRHHRKQE